MKIKISIAMVAAVATIAGSSVAIGQAPSKAALDDALKNGLLTQEEYNARVRQHQAGAAPIVDPSRIAWRTVSVPDPVLNIVAFTGSIPADWRFEGAVLRGGCFDAPSLVFRAYSPDGLTGVQSMPTMNWDYTLDRQAADYLAKFGTPCPFVRPPGSESDMVSILRMWAPQMRPNPQFGPVTPAAPARAAALEAAINKGNQSNFGMAEMASRYSGGIRNIHISYDYSPGHPVDEVLITQMVVGDHMVPTYTIGPGGVMQPRSPRVQHTTIDIRAERAPQGRLEASQNLLQRISFVKDRNYAMVEQYLKQLFDLRVQQLAAQAYQQRLAIINAGQAAIDATNQWGRERMASMQRQADEFHNVQLQSRERNMQQFYSDMNTQRNRAQDMIDYAGGNQYYVNPNTGATITLANVPGYGGYAVQNSWGNWTALQPILH